MFPNFSALIRASIASSVLVVSASAGTLFVDANLSTGLNDGSSWADAFQGVDGLQTALGTALAGDEVFVADGTYLASSTMSRADSFSLINDVSIFGGFWGGEATPAERPAFGTAPSILSGDLAGNDGSGGLADNTYHLIRTVGAKKTAVIDGFDVVAGVANSGGSNNDKGGGILCLGAVSPTVRNCRFINNRSTFGGAAGYINSGGFPSFTDCSFIGGVGGSYGGAFDIASGGPVRFERCLFENNVAARAGALEVFATTGVIVSNCVFRGNTSTGSGGGGAIWVGTGGDTKVRNCTIVGNFSTSNGVAGMRNQGATGTQVRNCIFWDNEGPGGAQGPANQMNLAMDATYSNVEGGFVGTGNVAGDPQFASIAAGDYRLTAGSPAVDAGNNASAPSGVIEDFSGFLRFVDFLAVLDTGSGASPIVDMGAHELQEVPFQSVPGCFGNTGILSTLSTSLALGGSLQLQATSALYPDGVTLYYAGANATDVAGCGLLLPGLGEFMLGIVPAPLLLGITPMAGGTSSLAMPIPAIPALAGVIFGFQAAHVATTVTGTPVELSNMLVAVVQP
jgi:hypothetical protein